MSHCSQKIWSLLNYNCCSSCMGYESVCFGVDSGIVYSTFFSTGLIHPENVRLLYSISHKSLQVFKSKLIGSRACMCRRKIKLLRLLDCKYINKKLIWLCIFNLIMFYLIMVFCGMRPKPEWHHFLLIWPKKLGFFFIIGGTFFTTVEPILLLHVTEGLCFRHRRLVLGDGHL